MMWAQVGITAAEKGFAFFTNVEGSTMAADAVVAIDEGSSCDGNRIVQPNTNFLDLVVGINDASLANGSSGRVQVYGYRATSKLFVTDTTGAAGAKLVPVAGQDYLATVAAGDGRDGLFAMISSLISSGASKTTTGPIFIRAC